MPPTTGPRPWIWRDLACFTARHSGPVLAPRPVGHSRRRCKVPLHIFPPCSGVLSALRRPVTNRDAARRQTGQRPRRTAAWVSGPSDRLIPVFIFVVHPFQGPAGRYRPVRPRCGSRGSCTQSAARRAAGGKRRDQPSAAPPSHVSQVTGSRCGTRSFSTRTHIRGDDVSARGATHRRSRHGARRWLSPVGLPARR